jgi:predicted dehydrogenase
MDKVRIGVLGCARITQQALIDAAGQVPEVEIVAVASRDGARAEAFAKTHGIPQAFAGYEALLASDDVDVVYNPLPNSLHAPWSIRALEAGKAVLCEKPLASNADEAKAMLEASCSTGRPLIEAFHYRHHPVAGFSAAKVRSGELGRLRRVAAVLDIPGRLLSADDIRFQNDLAGGATMDLGAYCINILRLVTDAEPAVTRASASITSPGIDGAMQGELLFPGGVEGSFECSLIHDHLTARLSIEGERGSLTAENPFLPQMGNSVSVTVDGVEQTERFDRTATYVFQLRSLIEVVRNGVVSPTSAADGVANMAVIDQVYSKAGLSPRG